MQSCLLIILTMRFLQANFNQTASWQNWWRFSSVGSVQHGQMKFAL
ncbi:MAG: hypothetical protein AVDCRST_MAG74-1677 [uncultured Pyrinomonadaceae bacterium]|uniref:Uncharacterized protein n=1 Tax=uncultured Pyrinomonadaceae bacterium TaxID=2283094 RepID=A0A6J4P0X8_9BACT|nr:MAG: hypothetical protein AVDCRST_MAG74-1677 [uncultured Pyrinomonadaceae bacterium]